MLLWSIRIVLILAFVFHIWSAMGLTRMNRKARPAAEGTRCETWLRRSDTRRGTMR